jgi:hypothetical protein
VAETRQVLEEVRDSYRREPKRFVFFVGAGLSIPLFPSWRAFLEELIRHAEMTGRLTTPAQELRDRVAQNRDYLDIADACINALGQEPYRTVLERAFSRDIEPKSIPPAYRELFDAAPPIILTTNYDRIPEVAGGGRYVTFTNKNTPEFLRAIQENTRAVLKLHGDVSQHDSIVLGSSDYSRIEANEQVQHALRTVFATRNVVFLGFGMSDPHIEHLLGTLKRLSGDKPLRHYALISNAASFDVNRLEHRYAIQVAPYAPTTRDHREVVEFVRSLRELSPLTEPAATLDADHFGAHVATMLRDRTGHNDHIVSIASETTVRVTLMARGQTDYELQRETLALIDVLGSAPTSISTAILCLVAPTQPSLALPESFPVFLECHIDLKHARRYATREIPERELWSTLRFEVPEPIGFPRFGPPATIARPYIGV